MGTLYLVRHGQASFGADDYDQLSDLGRRQSVRLGQYLRERYGDGLRFNAVLTGTASAHSDIHLHLFSDSAEAVSLRLEERGVPHETLERRLRFERDRSVTFPAFRFVAGKQTIDAVVFPLDGIRQSPCSPVDGKPMRRATATEVAALV